MPFIPYFRGRLQERLHLKNTDFCKPPSKPFRNTFHTHFVLVAQCNDRLNREWKYSLLCECSFQVLNEMTGGALGGFHRWLPLKSPLLSVPFPSFLWVKFCSKHFVIFWNFLWLLHLKALLSVWVVFFLGLFELCLPWKKFPVFFSSSIACVAFGPLYMTVSLGHCFESCGDGNENLSKIQHHL